MTKSSVIKVRRFVVAGLLVGITGACGSIFGGSAPVNYYTLTAAAVGDRQPTRRGGGIVAVQPVRLPEYLDQGGIVTRRENNLIKVSPDSRWAGSFAGNVNAALVANLGLAMGDHVFAYPVDPALPVERSVQVEIAKFEQQPDGRVLLTARWTIFADAGRTYLSSGSATFSSEPIERRDYEQLAASMSRLLAELSLELAADIQVGHGVGESLTVRPKTL